MKRIFGLETEFGIAYAPIGGRRLGPEEVARYLFKPVVAWGRSSNVFLPNGSRLYLDVGSHPEYATAECDRLDDLIAQDSAGTVIMQDLLRQANQALKTDGYDGVPHLFKNNSDSAGNSYGSHENFLIRRNMDFAHLTSTLLPFLVVRQLMVGAGAIIPRQVSTAMPAAQTNRANPNATQTLATPTSDVVFGLSGRSDVMWEGVSSATTRSRPIINARDEPHADAEKYRRLHVIVGDSSMAQPTTQLKVGSAALILDMIETGMPLRDLTLSDPIRDIRVIARDLTGTTPLELKAGGTLTAVDLLEIYLQAATTIVDRGDHSVGDDQTARAVLDLWKRMLEAVRTQDFSRVDTEIDWVIKKKILDRYMSRSQVELSDPRIRRLELAYHDVTPGVGLVQKMEAGGLIARTVGDTEVATAKDVPPQSTRAKIRGAFVEAAVEHRVDYTVDWVHLRLNAHAQRAVTLRDPFVSTSEHADELIACLNDSELA